MVDTMTVAELLARFPEIPRDLHDEPILGEFAAAFGDRLRIAREPSACATDHDATHRAYLELIGPIKIYGYGLATRDALLADLRKLLDEKAADPR